ncbi:universal stress protein [Microbacterium trichothecenolyticum]|uniref:Nucleotide-binding universal stress UspA family protein n=1 Tax=Microbacterium trichothecenolyticum TaxID=69370 RepID=A0ABU0TVD5_MICTR|nr:universal stress protein [Microbacterium trichothecenolyticum]MDQ1123623.1 nucleotide-binding universal stress UspA family protein [Microbacterium trichothecenolyticum]
MTDLPRPAASGPVIAGVVPGQSPRVVQEAARYAALAYTELVVAHVDTTRFVAFEDPDGYVHPSTVDLAGAAARAALEEVQRAADAALAGSTAAWRVRQVFGDPALALMGLADEVGASLLVVGTRKRGLGESLREFLTGSVAARLTHRQHRPVLVVPVDEPAGPDEHLPWEG